MVVVVNGCQKKFFVRNGVGDYVKIALMNLYSSKLKGNKEMRLIEHPMYRSEFPEKFNWNKLDSYSMTKIANEIKRLILRDLETEERSLVPGLRKTLNVIARTVSIE